MPGHKANAEQWALPCTWCRLSAFVNRTFCLADEVTKPGDSAQTQAKPSSTGHEGPHTKDLPKQDPAAPASQQPQQPSQQTQAKSTSTVEGVPPATAQQQQSQPPSKNTHKTQAENAPAKQGSGGAGPKTESAAPSGGAWGGARSFRDIAASKPDKVRLASQLSLVGMSLLRLDPHAQA